MKDSGANGFALRHPSIYQTLVCLLAILVSSPMIAMSIPMLYAIGLLVSNGVQLNVLLPAIPGMARVHCEDDSLVEAVFWRNGFVAIGTGMWEPSSGAHIP
jgi:hypothetical protein